MYFVDEVKVFLKAGSGGDGLVSFRREKFVEFGGPDGGNGGRGGNIIFVADESINTLIYYRNNKNIFAEDGYRGGKSNCTGKNGNDSYLKVPVGTQIINDTGNVVADLLSHDDQFCICQGGKGGAGNACFKNSTNQAPRQNVEGRSGEDGDFILKLKVLADVGLLGLPNVGKSTFLSIFSGAKPKISDYPFTTLIPNLGVVELEYHQFIIADIPGLIKGANQGVGLGIQFLKHLERCKIFLHILDVTSDSLVEDYTNIRTELSLYNKSLLEKIEIVLVNKIDLLSENLVSKKVQSLKEYLPNTEIYQMSVIKQNYDVIYRLHTLLSSLEDKSHDNYYSPL